MKWFGISRYIFRRYTLKSLVVFIATCCLIIAVTTVMDTVRKEEKTNERPWKARYDDGVTADSVSSTSDLHRKASGQSENVASESRAGFVAHATRDSEEAGALNLHVWSICGFDVQNLKHWPPFPSFPDRKSSLTNFTTEFKESNIGQRIFGFLIPQFSGRYHFAITSDDASELWLSTNEDPRKVRLIAEVRDNNSYAWTVPGDYKKYPTQISGAIFLNAGHRYFVECLHINGVDLGHVSVLWKPPRTGQFSIITREFLFPFCVNETNCVANEATVAFKIPSHSRDTPPKTTLTKNIDYHSTLHFNQKYLEGLLPVFPYHPSYVVRDGNVQKFQGIWIALAHHTFVYPEDDVQIKPGSFVMSSKREFRPNEVLPKDNAELIVSQFMAILEGQHLKRFSLDKIIGVEGKEDKVKGFRYLLQLQLLDTKVKKNLRLAEYVFRDFAGHLWFPKGLTWKRNATIHFVVPVKNQIKWVIYLVEEMSKLYQRTRDENFRLIIVDFESTDGDIDTILKNSPLSLKYALLKETGEFHKTLAIQGAVKTISDPDSIVFLFDLHITVPITLLDSIRKHTIQSKTVFLPIVARLECGFSPVNPKGRWEEIGSGLVAVYKSDWERFHGMNVEEFKTKWGGEDWDLLDRMLRVGLESERLKIPGFYHYYHTKKTMWDKSNT